MNTLTSKLFLQFFYVKIYSKSILIIKGKKRRKVSKTTKWKASPQSSMIFLFQFFLQARTYDLIVFLFYSWRFDYNQRVTMLLSIHNLFHFKSLFYWPEEGRPWIAELGTVAEFDREWVILGLSFGPGNGFSTGCVPLRLIFGLWPCKERFF